jgi:hypothetical protein
MSLRLFLPDVGSSAVFRRTGNQGLALTGNQGLALTGNQGLALTGNQGLALTLCGVEYEAYAL